MKAGCINVDDGVGQIVGLLKKLGLTENTTLIITSDHGSHLGEHKFIGNGRLLYDSEIRIPLIISGPMAEGVRNKKNDALVSNCDIFPTHPETFWIRRRE